MIRRSVALLLVLTIWPSATALGQITFGERTYEYSPSDVLHGATDFVRVENYWVAFGSRESGPRTPMGWVLLTDDLVEIPGYSGHTINTLVGIDPQGKITGVKIVQHAEPIVLIGLSEKVIHDFVAQYVGRDIRERIIISDRPAEGYVNIDAISGATVTAVAENTTILEAARRLGRSVGLVKAHEIRRRRPSDRFEMMAWEGLVATGAIGEIAIPAGEVGKTGDSPALELKFALLDLPMVGRNLLGDRYYKIVQDRLRKNGGSALFIGGAGPVSFKGAGFARGGIFDRFSVEQGSGLYVFTDMDYMNLTDIAIEDAPTFKEGGVFFFSDATFDPAEPFTLHLTLPFRSRDKRAYATFLASYELPPDLIEEDEPFWVRRWRDMSANALGFAVFIVAVSLLFAFRQRMLTHRKRLHYTVAAIAAVWVGLVLKAQPSTTQILTLVNSGVQLRFPQEIYLSEPVIFLFWIAIAISLVIWGRGFFCGWLCPYGALLELLIGVWHRVAPTDLRERLDAWDPGPVWRAGKYVTFFIILAVSFASLPTAEMLDEVEPFKTFILRLARPAPFVAYFVVITLVSVPLYRFFCRFLCPLGGALAISGRKPLSPLFRYDRCTTCKICYKGCEPKAISKQTGQIDYSECLQCWDCQMTGNNETVCPALIVAKREGTAPARLYP
jgi:NosR/NirI family nitrous oxide reductase transcriptional regulator